jgi:hypothetical protein
LKEPVTIKTPDDYFDKLNKLKQPSIKNPIALLCVSGDTSVIENPLVINPNNPLMSVKTTIHRDNSSSNNLTTSPSTPNEA